MAIRAGHCGSDPGAVAVTGQKEANTNYNVATYLEDYLLSSGKYEVYFINRDKVTIKSGAAARKANAWKPDIYIDIHHNSAKVTTAVGCEVFYQAGNEKSKRLAECVNRELAKFNGATRGIKTDAELATLNTSICPTIIGEAAFMSTRKDLDKVDTYTEQKAEALAYFKGIEAYFSVGIS